MRAATSDNACYVVFDPWEGCVDGIDDAMRTTGTERMSSTTDRIDGTRSARIFDPTGTVWVPGRYQYIPIICSPKNPLFRSSTPKTPVLDQNRG